MGFTPRLPIVTGHMFLKKILPGLALLAALLSSVAARAAEKSAAAKRCTVMAYNVENLFDLDAISLYDDFPVSGTGPERWTPEKLAGKLSRLAAVLKTSDNGRGPDVVILDELEADHTPATTITPEAFVAAHRDRNYRDILKGELSPELVGAPIEAWLIKALEDEGLTGYKIILGDVLDLSKEAIHCAILTRLPIKSTRQHHVEAARTIVEVEVEFGGESLFVFANHWKSGAGSAQTEPTRIQNASVARARLDEILKADPKANIVFGGDLNSHYNHQQRYPYMPKTGIQDVLGSQGDAGKLASGAADLYNLWFDVEPAERKSDEYQGEWGTLMHLVISRGLADGNGVDYVGGSFGAIVLPGLNAHAYPVVPWRLSNYGPGAGVSDHFPIKAEFVLRTEAGASPLTRPELAPAVGLPAFPAELDRSKLHDAKTLATLSPDLISKSIGELYLLEGICNGGSKPSITIGEVRYPVYVPDPKLLQAVKAVKKGVAVKWVGQLNFYKGHLEFAIVSPDWIKAR
jgi:hypothetical protein